MSEVTAIKGAFALPSEAAEVAVVAHGAATAEAAVVAKGAFTAEAAVVAGATTAAAAVLAKCATGFVRAVARVEQQTHSAIQQRTVAGTRLLHAAQDQAPMDLVPAHHRTPWLVCKPPPHAWLS